MKTWRFYFSILMKPSCAVTPKPQLTKGVAHDSFIAVKKTIYSNEKRDVQKISDDELTPVVPKSGKVEGWGRSYLAAIAPSYRFRYNY
jgi:hypothetical protein